jgi:hypothetical protein
MYFLFSYVQTALPNTWYNMMAVVVGALVYCLFIVYLVGRLSTIRQSPLLCSRYSWVMKCSARSCATRRGRLGGVRTPTHSLQRFIPITADLDVDAPWLRDEQSTLQPASWSTSMPDAATLQGTSGVYTSSTVDQLRHRLATANDGRNVTSLDSPE